MKIKILILLSFFINIFADNNLLTKNKDFKFASKASKKELEQFSKLANQNKALFAKSAFDPNDLGSFDGYFVDINNDGKKEFVFIKYWKRNEVYVFSVNNNKLKALDFANTEKNINSPFKYPYDEGYKLEIFLYKNNLYICINGYRDSRKELFLWKDNKLKFICEKFWVNEIRKFFNDLYNQGEFQDGYYLLANFEKDCRKKLDKTLDLWLRNDIALAAIKSGFLNRALKVIRGIKKEPEFIKMSKNFHDAVKNNESLCIKLIAKDKQVGTGGRYNYDWLLEYKDTKSHKCIVAEDPRSKALLSAAFPDIDSSITDLGEIELRLWVSSDLKFSNNNRYASFSGFWPGSAGSKGFFWCDLKNKVSVIAINDVDDDIYIISRSLWANELPNECLEEIKNWLKEKKIEVRDVIFLDRLDDKTNINDSYLG